jgi:hypothetical protein
MLDIGVLLRKLFFKIVLNYEPIAKVVLLTKKGKLLIQPPNPQSLAAARELRLPPKGARDVIAPQSLPAPFWGRMSEGQKGGCGFDNVIQGIYI